MVCRIFKLAVCGIIINLAGGCSAKLETSKVASVAEATSCLVEDDAFINDNGGCHQLSTGITWGAVFNDQVSVSAAINFCRGLTTFERRGDSRVSFGNWELPSAEDLRRIVGADLGKRHLRIREGFFWTTSGIQSDVPEIPSEQTVIDLLTGETASYTLGTQKAGFVCRRITSDSDFDGIADESDICSGTPPSVHVALSGSRKGCADGQETDQGRAERLERERIEAERRAANDRRVAALDEIRKQCDSACWDTHDVCLDACRQNGYSGGCTYDCPKARMTCINQCTDEWFSALIGR